MEKDNKARRYNEGKLEWSLVHFKSLEPMIRVLEYGAEKYTVRDKETGQVTSSGRHNWKNGMDKEKILECAMRHLTAIFDGETTDKESGLPHIGHLMCNAMFYQYYIDKETEEFYTKGNIGLQIQSPTKPS